MLEPHPSKGICVGRSGPALLMECERCSNVFKAYYSGRRFCSRRCRWKWPDIFWEKVNKDHPTDCWIWTADTSEAGYGQLTIHGEPKAAHRVSWEMHYGPIPPKMCVCHGCDNPPCVRPEHLFLGTNADNNWDTRMKGRINPTRGERSHNVKLTKEQVLEIRRVYKRGPNRFVGGTPSTFELARTYGVHQVTISNVLLRKSWAWLKQEVVSA